MRPFDGLAVSAQANGFFLCAVCGRAPEAGWLVSAAALFRRIAAGVAFACEPCANGVEAYLNRGEYREIGATVETLAELAALVDEDMAVAA